jgi:hypothetical protein
VGQGGARWGKVGLAGARSCDPTIA